MTATERAWQREFKGDAAEVLLQAISNFLDKKRDPYSRQATIVNSSGHWKVSNGRSTREEDHNSTHVSLSRRERW